MLGEKESLGLESLRFVGSVQNIGIALARRRQRTVDVYVANNDKKGKKGRYYYVTLANMIKKILYAKYKSSNVRKE